MRNSDNFFVVLLCNKALVNKFFPMAVNRKEYRGWQASTFTGPWNETDIVGAASKAR